MTRDLDTDVIICGAGPTGLVLALRLARSGVRFRIIDMALEAGTASRALVVHARTVEFYRMMGFAEAFTKECAVFDAMNLWVRGRHAARVQFGALGKGLTAFPYMLAITQDRHERFLEEQLRRAGVTVERGTELVHFTQDNDRVHVRLRTSEGEERTCVAAYLAGCDGARSKVREVLGIGFPGGTYSHVFYVTDVVASGPSINRELHLSLDDDDFMGIFPFPAQGTARLIGTVRAGTKTSDEIFEWADVRKRSMELMNIHIDRINWFSTYNVHHRVANRFRDGRAFLLGDAAHIHSPAGGQGMNTGIGDAMNLAWKLADVVHGRAMTAVLDTFEPERMAFARRLVNSTDRAFTVATSSDPVARFVRLNLAPRLMAVLARFDGIKRFMFRTVSQTSIRYRESALSGGKAGKIHGGDRLPWVVLDDATDNFSVLDDGAWQVHVYGTPASGLADLCGTLKVALHAFPWRPEMRRSGLIRDVVYFVRPDGYVSWVGSGSAVESLARHASGILRSQ